MGCAQALFKRTVPPVPHLQEGNCSIRARVLPLLCSREPVGWTSANTGKLGEPGQEWLHANSWAQLLLPKGTLCPVPCTAHALETLQQHALLLQHSAARQDGLAAGSCIS